MKEYEINLGAHNDLGFDFAVWKNLRQDWKLIGSKRNAEENIFIWEKPDGFWIEEFGSKMQTIRAYFLVSSGDIDELVKKIR